MSDTNEARDTAALLDTYGNVIPIRGDARSCVADQDNADRGQRPVRHWKVEG